MIDDIIDFIRDSVNASSGVGEKAFLTLVVLVLALVIRKLAKWIVSRFTDDEKMVRRFTRSIATMAVILAVVITFLIWFNALDSLVLIVLIGLLVVVLSMQTLVLNLFAFFYIKTQAPFEVGDRIEIDGVRGDVENIGFFEFSVSEVEGWLSTSSPTGRLIHIPNSEIFKKAFANERGDFPYLWCEIVLPISHASNLAKAEQILLDASKRQLDMILAEEEDLDKDRMNNLASIYESKIDPVVSINIDGSGIELVCRFLTPYNEIAATTTRLWKDVHSRLSGVDDIAYGPNTYRVVNSGTKSDIE